MSAAPPPPPKPTNSSGHGTPLSGPSLPPPIPLPESGWLPDSLRDKSTTDLQHILSTPSLQSALVHKHPAISQSFHNLQQLLDTNISLANSLEQTEAQVLHQRSVVQNHLFALRAQEQQYRAKIAETEAAVREFSPARLYQQLSAGVGEQNTLCTTMADSFLESGGDGPGQIGAAGERDISDFVKRIREASGTAFLRKERKERWSEGRVGGL